MSEIKKRGFGSMDPDKQRMFASLGGKTAHALGRAHKWTREEASKAGKQGGKALQGSKYDKHLLYKPRP